MIDSVGKPARALLGLTSSGKVPDDWPRTVARDSSVQQQWGTPMWLANLTTLMGPGGVCVGCRRFHQCGGILSLGWGDGFVGGDDAFNDDGWSIGVGSALQLGWVGKDQGLPSGHVLIKGIHDGAQVSEV
mmetsp:Transcript_146099/g.255103  ORF Transcript_146099/g.255103 Transcript_146099/m.255103 type:complete len:130 (+) Transcript_146099:2656-3045(+)